MTMSTFVSVHVLGKQGKLKKRHPSRDSLTHCAFDAAFIGRMVERGREIVAKHDGHLFGRYDCLYG